MLGGTSLANTTQWWPGAREGIVMRVPEEVRKCVVYLGTLITNPDGQQAMHPKGTAFFVSLPSERIQGTDYIYLVTAKHVAEQLQGSEFAVRVNLTGGGASFIRSGAGAQWRFHPTDPSVDAAVLPWAPPEEVEHLRVPTRMFLTDEIIHSKNIGTGDEVFITGLFVHLAGAARNIPIVRMGNIAMMPPEPVPTSVGLIDAYLIEARSIGGLSGSPAFVRETVGFGLGEFYLLGLMHGHWDIPLRARDDQPTQDREEAYGKVNLGIAIVVPAKKVLEVLNHPQLVERRDMEDEELRKKTMPTLDEGVKPGSA
jgi:hypothetical protein